MSRRFLNIESNQMLDPLLKKTAFADTRAAEQCVQRLTQPLFLMKIAVSLVHPLTVYEMFN